MSEIQTEKVNGPLPAMIREYQVESLIGSGSTGKVYKAKDPRSGQTVAIRCFDSGHTPENGFPRDFSHADLVRCSAYDKDAEGHAFLVMEYMDGGTASDVLKKLEMLEPDKVAEIGITCCNALEAVQTEKLSYYDVTPERIMLSADGKYKLSPSGFNPDPDLMEYMAPEQFTGLANFDLRSAVYSLGVTMYQLLSGKLPFESSDRKKLKQMHESADPKVPGFFRSDAPVDLEYIIMRCLQKDKKERYQHWGELRTDLQAFLDKKPLPSIKDSTASDAGRSRPILTVNNAKKKTLLVNGIAGGICAILAGLFLWGFISMNQPDDGFIYVEGEDDTQETAKPAPSGKAPPAVSNRDDEAKIWLKVRQNAKDALASGENCALAAVNLEKFEDSPDEAIQKEARTLLNEIDLRTGLREWLCSSILPLLKDGKYKEAHAAYESKMDVYRGKALEKMLSELKCVPELFAEAYGNQQLSSLPVMEQYEKLQKIPELSSNSITWWCCNAAIQKDDEKAYLHFRGKLPRRLGAVYDQYRGKGTGK